LLRPTIVTLAGLILTSCAGPESAELEGGWRRKDLGPFSLAMPGDLKEVPVKPIDSYVGEFRGPATRLSFDFGQWSDPLTDNEGVVSRESILIGGRAARLVFSKRVSEPPYLFCAAVHFPARKKEGALLTVCFESKESASAETARRIFESIRFKGE
jgi:hypothetical protein